MIDLELGENDMNELTQSRLKELLDYNQETGIFTCKVARANNSIPVGSIAGSLSNGYIRICIYGRSYMAHRLAWLYVYGVWPDNEIDHKDTVKHHNWLNNLRDVTHSGNQQNVATARRNNKTGLLGSVFHKASGKYQAAIVISGKKQHLGIFSTPEEAHEVYLAAKRIHHSTCTI